MAMRFLRSLLKSMFALVTVMKVRGDVPSQPHHYNVDLSTPPKTHFSTIANDYKLPIQDLLKYFLNSYHIPDAVLPLVNEVGSHIDRLRGRGRRERSFSFYVVVVVSLITTLKTIVTLSSLSRMR